MLRCFDKFIKSPPKFDPDFQVFLPFTAVLQIPMSYSNGLAILVNHKVNDEFRKIFAVWSSFLSSPESSSVLTEDKDGWLGPIAMERMPDFRDTFVCDPTKPHWGFDCWNHFFSRKLQTHARPVGSPHDSSIITSACESKVLRQSRNVKVRDQFWLKSQPYSLVHLLNDPLASSFVEGTIYQAFLCAFDYHRWHSPVDGTIVKTHLVEGTYFAGIPTNVPPSVEQEGFHEHQEFLAHVATRALIFIQADDDRIGPMCFIAVGMVEVSNCTITVQPAQRVRKGQEIGTFNFGGETHCSVFGPHVKLEFLNKVDDRAEVRSAIARVL